MNVGGGQAFSSGTNIGGTIQGLSSNVGTSFNRNSVPGMSGSPAFGNLGPCITKSVGKIVGGSNIGRNISSGGLSVPSITSRINFSGNTGSGSLRIQQDDEWPSPARTRRRCRPGMPGYATMQGSELNWGRCTEEHSEDSVLCSLKLCHLSAISICSEIVTHAVQ